MEYAISISSSKGVLIQPKNSENYMNVFEYSVFFKFNFCNNSFITDISMFYVIMLRIPFFFVLLSK